MIRCALFKLLQVSHVVLARGQQGSDTFDIDYLSRFHLFFFMNTFLRDCIIRRVKTKALISFAVTAKLICVFVFTYAKGRFSHDVTQIGDVS